MEPTTLALVQLYGDLVDAWIIDAADADDVAAVEAAGIRCVATATLMRGVTDQAQLARTVLQVASDV